MVELDFRMQIMWIAGLTAIILSGQAWAKPMKKHIMHDKGHAGIGAVCLDGTPAGFYYAPASAPHAAKTWQIYFEGGGWCYSELDCWGRANNSMLGSSKNWPETDAFDGLMSDDCSVNPDFCHAHRVELGYCDGNSFSGDREEPVLVKGPDGVAKNLYFRGKRIVDAVLDTLLEHYGLADAEEILLTGCSAGGLAVYLHTDYVHKRLKESVKGLQKFRAASISGFFPKHHNVMGEPVYEDQIKNIFYLSNASSGVDAKCIAARKPEQQWECNFAEVAYAYVEAPIFVFNSALDAFGLGCIFDAAYPTGFPNQTVVENGNCTAYPSWNDCCNQPENCTAPQVKALDGYMTDFNAKLEASPTYSKTGNGAFVGSCFTHCEAEDAGWNKIVINGKTIQQAFSAWWHSNMAPASEHTYTPCSLRPDKTPHRCNPTCVDVGKPSLLHSREERMQRRQEVMQEEAVVVVM